MRQNPEEIIESVTRHQA
ncbi:MAG: hypothetical protein ACFCVA_07950 [Gammaproteobacteria bacterium]